MDEEQMLGAPAWVQFIHKVWLLGLLILCGYLSYWFSHDFWWWLDSFSDGQNIRSGKEASQAIWVQYSDGWWQAIGFLAAIIRISARAFWWGVVIFSVAVCLPLVFKPLQFAWMIPLTGRSSAGGIAGWKRTKGFFAGTAISIVFLWVPYFLLMLGTGLAAHKVSSFGNPDGFAGYSVTFYVWVAVMLSPLALYFFWLKNAVRERIGRLTSPVRRWWRRRGFGAGGSAGFAGMLEEWSLRYKSGALLLGTSLYSGKSRESVFKIGNNDDRGFLTIASNRSGKGRSAIIPNLIEWPHSCLCIDPKGTNAAVTAARRGKGGGRVTSYLGQDVYVVDPFQIVAGVDQAAFNPLSAIDIDAITVAEDIDLLADALIVPESGNNAMHFVNSAKTIVAGVIAHALTVAKEKGWKNTPTLLDVRYFLSGSAEELDELFGAMRQNEKAGGLPRIAANLVDAAGDNERGAMITTVASNMKWLDSKAMKTVLERSDFSLADLKNGNTTIYIVLPPHLLDEHKRFMRLFVNLAVREMSQGTRSKNPVLFVLDEFFSLGTMTLLEKAAGLLAGYNMKLWPILQNLSQLKELYPNNWETFFSNAGAVQVFSVNDQETASYLVDMIGKSTQEIKVDERLQRVVSSLLETEELEQYVAREAGVQIVRRSGAPPLLLRRINYDQSYRKNQYSDDPDHPTPWYKKLNPY